MRFDLVMVLLLSAFAGRGFASSSAADRWVMNSQCSKGDSTFTARYVYVSTKKVIFYIGDKAKSFYHVRENLWTDSKGRKFELHCTPQMYRYFVPVSEAGKDSENKFQFTLGYYEKSL
jgi:hypothetical protein